MARQLTTTYQTAMAQPVRHPAPQVLAYPSGVAQDISADMLGWSSTRYYTHRAGKATLTVVNPGGRYHPGGPSPRADWLAPGTRVVLRQGLRGAMGVEQVSVFTGTVCTAEAGYRRGEGETLTVHLLDRAGDALQREICSELYTNHPARDIITALFTAHGVSASEIVLAPSSYRVPRIQFVAETLMDAGQLLAEAMLQHLYFDADGVLRSRPLALPGTVDWTYADGRAVVSVRDGWEVPTFTACLVTGRTLPGLREVSEEVLWQSATVQGYEWGAMVNIPFMPRGAVFEDIRLEVAGTLAPFEQVALYSADAKGIVVKVVSPIGRTLTIHCFGKQVYYNTPYVQAVAKDDALIARFGQVRMEHANTTLGDTILALALATHQLDLARWRQHTVTARLLANPGLEPGDLLSLTHPRTGQALLLLADTVTHAARRGSEDATTVTGLVVA
jgi:hypothetical protein